MEWHIRPAEAADAAPINDLVRAAFGAAEGQEIAELVASLLVDATAEPRLSMVAVHDATVVGHVLFTRADVESPQGRVRGSILAPLAVLPDYQSRGIGGRLIAEGVSRLEATDTALLFVLGDPGYYGRHGFRPAAGMGLQAPYPMPAEQADAWMVRPLKAGHAGGVRGRVACAASLMDARHWRE